MNGIDFNQIINTETPVLVSISSRYCDPCFLHKMILDKVKKYIGQKIFIISIDADNFQELAAEHNAIDKPALLLFTNGKLIWKQKEILSTKEIIQIVLEKTF